MAEEGANPFSVSNADQYECINGTGTLTCKCPTTISIPDLPDLPQFQRLSSGGPTISATNLDYGVENLNVTSASNTLGVEEYLEDLMTSKQSWGIQNIGDEYDVAGLQKGFLVCTIIVSVMVAVLLIAPVLFFCWWKFRDEQRNKPCLTSSQKKSTRQTNNVAFENNPTLESRVKHYFVSLIH